MSATGVGPRDADRSPFVVTTSWDDGCPGDLRIAERLATLGLKGTFYIPRQSPGGPRMTEAQIRELAGYPGVEIGSHTLTHPDLDRLDADRFRVEVEGGKQWLEDLIGEPVSSFCYPRGKFTGQMRDLSLIHISEPTRPY